MSPSDIRWMWLFTLCELQLWINGQDLSSRRDPTPIIYPGQVNIAYLANIHEAPTANSTATCGRLRPEGVQKAMASVWSAHQANFRKEDHQELNVGVYIFDTCGREDVAERQVYRLLGHVGHVQSISCSEKRIPPLFAVITEGDSESLRVPSKLLEAFGVPIISASNDRKVQANVLTTAPTDGALARAAVTVLRHLHLLEVAVIAEENSPSAVFQEFTKEAQTSGMQALPVSHPSIEGHPESFLSTLRIASGNGKARLKAVVFLVDPEQALDLLRFVHTTQEPQMPWVIVTHRDLAPSLVTSFKRQQLRKFQKVLLLSAETSTVPEFYEYFKELQNEETIKYHPLLVEFAEFVKGEKNQSQVTSDTGQSPFINWNNSSDHTRNGATNTFTFDDRSLENQRAVFRTYSETDVSPVVKAVWSLAASLKSVQKKSCRRGTDCLLYLRRSLSSYVFKAAKALDHSLDIASSLHGTRLKFHEDGSLDSVRYSLKGFTSQGNIQEVGWYSDETGLAADNEILSPFRESTTNRESEIQGHQSEKSSKSKNASSNSATMPPTMEYPSSGKRLSLEENDYVRWKILDEASLIREPSHHSALETHDNENYFPSSVDKDYSVTEEDIAVSKAVDIYNHIVSPNHDTHETEGVINRTSTLLDENTDDDLLLGPSYTNEQHKSSNLRSISLTSHKMSKIDEEEYWPYKEDFRTVQSAPDAPAVAKSIAQSSVNVLRPTLTEQKEEMIVTPTIKKVHLSAWLARPCALAILGLCGFGLLVTMYILVFIMVKSCEGTLKKTNTFIAVVQLIAVLSLYFSAALYTWKPSSLLCSLERLIPNISYGLCFGSLLLKGMHLRAQSSLGLGGSVNRCNQILTLFFVVGVQIALEIQWWFMRPVSMTLDTLQCTTRKEEILESQCYVFLLLLLSVAVAVSSRKGPYNDKESRSLIGTSLTCLMVFLSWDAACWLLPDSSSRNIAAPAGLMATAFVVLAGIFGPQLFAIHKYGGLFPHKPLSYADSLSTVFTMFKDLDNGSNNGTTGRGKKSAKTLETPFLNEISQGTRNPLYSDYQSAYP